MTNEALWSTRNVAEYAYCPRLFYLMEVEGIHLSNADTERGMAVHRRVDKPNVTTRDPDDEGPKVIRSLTLSSKSLGITATIDLAEVSGKIAIPVEYRKGRPRISSKGSESENTKPLASEVEPWPIDRVQLGLQAILLEEAGFEVREAMVYYTATKERLRMTYDDTLREEALAILEAARQCALQPRPLPLVNDSRCPGCSLQPVCLPDEVNYLRAANSDSRVSPRKIWPPRDDGIHLVAQSNGIKIGVRGMSIQVKDKAGTTLKEVPLANLESLSLLGSVQISTQAVHVLAGHGIPIAYLSAVGRLVAMVDPLDTVSAAVRRSQVLKFESQEVCLELARALIAAKIQNQRTLLMRNHSGLSKVVSTELAKIAKRATRAESLEELRGYEGQAAAIYFGHFAGMFKVPTLADEFAANGRQRRPAPDPINACISMGYSMLVHECVAALRLARLEPVIGAFHVSKPGRPALALDLMEPFRPLIADSIALTAFNRNELGEGHFLRTAAGCVLTAPGRHAFFNTYNRRMNTEITHPVFKYKLSYRRMLVLHARMIAAWLTGEVPNLVFLTTR
ncbi:MAG: CRISPR-associated endonuclease Cas4g/Cas1g [bacterium]